MAFLSPISKKNSGQTFTKQTVHSISEQKPELFFSNRANQNSAPAKVENIISLKCNPEANSLQFNLQKEILKAVSFFANSGSTFSNDRLSKVIFPHHGFW